MHGYPLVERPAPAPSEAEQASIEIKSQLPDRGVYQATLPSGATYEMEHNLVGPWKTYGASPTVADLDHIKRHVATMVESGTPEAEIDEYIKRHGATVEQVRDHRIGARKPEDIARDTLRGLLQREQDRRSANWSDFTQIVPIALAGAFLIGLFGRAVRYVLANE